MNRISSFLTDYLLKNEVIDENDYEIYRYGLLSGTEMLICVVTCYLFAAQMGMFFKCTLLMCIFFSLRSYVGGFHLNSFKACYICSCLVIVFVLMGVKNVPMPKFYSLIASILEVTVIFFLKPVENKNRPVNDYEKKIFLNRIKVISLVILMLAIFCYSFNAVSYLDTITYTLGTILISMLLGKFREKINRERY